MALSDKQNSIGRLWNDIKANEVTIDLLRREKLDTAQAHSTNNAVENFTTNPIVHAAVVYDLYNFLGVTYTNEPTQAVPSEYYTPNDDNTAFTFNLPVYGYKILQGQDPEEVLGVGPWSYKASVVIIKNRIIYKGLPDKYVQKGRVISYLYTDDNTPVPSQIFQVDPIKQIDTDYAFWYRWIKVEGAYHLDFYAFYLWNADVDIKLKTNVYFIDKDLGNEIQSHTIQTASVRPPS